MGASFVSTLMLMHHNIDIILQQQRSLTDHVIDPLNTTRVEATGKASARANTTLEFVHIPKTAGTSIEHAAAKAGIAWGVCKFYLCPPLNESNITQEDTQEWACEMKTHPWHCPPRHLKHSKRMYERSNMFTVVRDPYERIISEYYYLNSFVPTTHSRAKLNRWIIRQLNMVNRTGVCGQGHCIPMHKYTHDLEGKQIINHIVRFERLDKELPVLLEQYGLSEITLGEKRERSSTVPNRFSRKHLAKETIRRINEWARKDFELFKYEMIDVGAT